MRRLLIGALALAALVAGSSVAFAGASKPVTGTLTGTADWQGIHVASWPIHGTYTSDTLGSGTYAGTLTTTHTVLDASVEDPPGCFAAVLPCNSSPRFDVSGAITFTADNGASFTGAVASGSSFVESDTVHVVAYTFTLQLTVGDGTKRFKHDTRTLSLSYQSNVTNGVGCGADCGVVFDSGNLTGTVGH